jgi:hypothetical protein
MERSDDVAFPVSVSSHHTRRIEAGRREGLRYHGRALERWIAEMAEKDTASGEGSREGHHDKKRLGDEQVVEGEMEVKMYGEEVIYDSMFETDKGVGGGTQRRNSDQVDQRR